MAGAADRAAKDAAADDVDEPAGDDKVTVKLAHHLPVGNPYTKKKQKPGDKITVSFNEAQLLAQGAYLAVNPADADAVRKMIGRGPAAAVAGREASPTPDA